MRLNGWTRVWLLATVLWLLLLAWQYSFALTRPTTSQSITDAAFLAATPLLALHTIGLAVAYARRGFMQSRLGER
jgi:hypothetical protein